MNYLSRISFRKYNVLGLMIGLALLAGCTKDQNKEANPVPNIPQPQEATCLLSKVELSAGITLTMDYDQNRKLSSYTSFIAATKYHGDLTSTYTITRDTSGKIIRLQAGQSETIIDYDQKGRWTKTRISFPPAAPHEITYPDYNTAGQITRISNIVIYPNTPDRRDTIVIDYAWQNGNVVKQINYINNKPYESIFEYDLTQKAKHSEYDLLKVYYWDSKPLSEHLVKKIITQTDVPDLFSTVDITREFNSQGYVTKASSISSFKGKVSSPTTSTYTYQCE